jgi:riboflavin-specific deaminase-like protein
MTADGKIATADRSVSAFGGAADRRHLFELRATADAVMAGARTVDTNPVTLGPGGAVYRRRRVAAGLDAGPLRIVVSGAGTIDTGAAIFKSRHSPVVVLVTGRASRARRAALESVADSVRVSGRREMDFAGALRWLRQVWRVRRLLVEGGGELNGALFRAGLVDELHLTICPCIVGGREAPTIADGAGVERLRLAGGFRLVSLRRAGADCFLVYRKL